MDLYGEKVLKAFIILNCKKHTTLGLTYTQCLSLNLDDILFSVIIVSVNIDIV